MQEVTFHEFIYFNQYIVCFFNEIDNMKICSINDMVSIFCNNYG